MLFSNLNILGKLKKNSNNSLGSRILNKSMFRKFLYEEDGSATAEYAIIALCAVTFAGILLGVLKGGMVQDMLSAIITKALEIL